MTPRELCGAPPDRNDPTCHPHALACMLPAGHERDFVPHSWQTPVLPPRPPRPEVRPMIRAVSKTADGGNMLLLGLTPAEPQAPQGQASRSSSTLRRSAVPGVRVCIMFGQTERSILAELRSGGIELPDDAEQSVADVEAEHREKGTRP